MGTTTRFPNIAVRILGPAELTVGPARLDVSQPLTRALAVRLAGARGEAVADDILVRELWGDTDLARPAARLRVLASRLRGALGDHGSALRRTAAGFSLQAVPVDLLAVEEAMTELDASRRTRDQARIHAAAASALGQWRGEPLGGLPAVPYVAAERQRLRSLRLELQLEWIESGLATGVAEVQPELERLAALNPLHERLIGLSAWALASSGRLPAALARLDLLRQTLAAELGIDPAPETVALEHRLRTTPPPQTIPGRSAAGAPLAAPGLSSGKVSLPQASKSFVGRDQEYGELLGRIERPCAITLTGGPGVGKTRLARELAAAEQQRGRLVCWLDLAPLNSADNLVSVLAAAVGVDGSVADPHATCAEALAGALLVIDNAEHLVEAAAALVDDLDWQRHDISVLVTSQRPLHLSGELAWRVGPLDTAAAAALFCARSAVEASTEVDAICAAVDRFPLAIELAAGLTRTLSVSQLAERIDNRLRLLVRGPRDAGLRHTSLRAALDWSHELLEKPARLALWRLSVFAGGCTADAATGVLADDELPADDVPGLLAELSDRGLLTIENNQDGTRYRLLETVRDYALDRLRDSADEQPVRRRHVAWCADLLAYQDRLAGRTSIAERSRQVGTEEANLLTAIEWCLGRGSEPEKVSAIVAPLWWYWPFRGLTAEAAAWLRQSVAALPMDSEQYAAALSTLASLTRNLGDFTEARALGERCLAAYRALGDEERVMITLMSLTRTCLAQNDMPSTLEYAEQVEARTRADDQPTKAARAAALNYMGLAHRNLGHPAEATELFTAAQTQWLEIGDDGGASIALENLAIVARHNGQLDRAAELAGQSLRSARDSDFAMGLCAALESLACVAVSTGQPEEALRLLTVAELQRGRIGSPVQVPDELVGLEETRLAARAALGAKADAVVAAAKELNIETVADDYLNLL